MFPWLWKMQIKNSSSWKKLMLVITLHMCVVGCMYFVWHTNGARITVFCIKTSVHILSNVAGWKGYNVETFLGNHKSHQKKHPVKINKILLIYSYTCVCMDHYCMCLIFPQSFEF